MKKTLPLTVNGERHDLTLHPDTPLLYVLRNDLALNGPKFGCGLGQCGSCMVLIDGSAVPSCLVTATAAAGKRITTLEGLTGPDGALHPVQEAFVEHQAAQCGFCLNGMILSAVAILDEDPAVDESALKARLRGNLCRCGTHSRMLRAIRAAAGKLNG